MSIKLLKTLYAGALNLRFVVHIAEIKMHEAACFVDWKISREDEFFADRELVLFWGDFAVFLSLPWIDKSKAPFIQVISY